jgi:hypothetical protein
MRHHELPTGLAQLLRKPPETNPIFRCCHVCQHAKVGASSTLACENKECCSRFCEHCLLALLGETVEPDMSSDAWSMVSGKVRPTIHPRPTPPLNTAQP